MIIWQCWRYGAKGLPLDPLSSHNGVQMEGFEFSIFHFIYKKTNWDLNWLVCSVILALNSELCFTNLIQLFICWCIKNPWSHHKISLCDNVQRWAMYLPTIFPVWHDICQTVGLNLLNPKLDHDCYSCEPHVTVGVWRSRWMIKVMCNDHRVQSAFNYTWATWEMCAMRQVVSSRDNTVQTPACKTGGPVRIYFGRPEGCSLLFKVLLFRLVHTKNMNPSLMQWGQVLKGLH